MKSKMSRGYDGANRLTQKSPYAEYQPGHTDGVAVGTRGALPRLRGRREQSQAMGTLWRGLRSIIFGRW
jgi:hypothetical protein